MFLKEIKQIESLSDQKIEHFTNMPSILFVSAMLAGAYIGFGIILIFTLGEAFEPKYQPLIMGLSFGIALTLIIIAGAELFTGYPLFFSIAFMQQNIRFVSCLKISMLVWIANLFGAIIISVLYKYGAGALTDRPGTLVQLIAANKISLTPLQLVSRAILCNWLVCLAIWMALKVDSDTAKCIVIFWCLFAFIGSGYEHSIANMAVFSLALLGPTFSGVTVLGAAHKLLWVTCGNIIGGVVFVGMAYHYISKQRSSRSLIQAKLGQ